MAARFWPAIFAALLAGGAAAFAQTPVPVRAAPTRPGSATTAWPTERLYNADYVDVREVAKRHGLKTEWLAPGKTMQLSAPGGPRLRFDDRERDFRYDGLRVFMSAVVVSERDTLWVGKSDVTSLLAPLLRPADFLAKLPAAPPKLIVLDPGHGGTDPGKQNPRLKLNEKDMALDVAQRLKLLLEKAGYRVKLTRESDTRFSNNPVVDLQKRAAFANDADADLFLSIHFNAVEPRDAARVTGTETYVMPPQFALSTADVRPDEMTNRAYPGNRHDTANLLLGAHLHRQFITGLGQSDRGYKRARFSVLRFIEAPAALIEAAYLSNDTEAARIGQPEFRQKIAEAIAKGVADYAAQLAALRAPPPPANTK
jgi:N-acetylmuramoyl-L-alanine amidase